MNVAPVYNKLPPVAASYHLIIEPPETLGVAVIIAGAPIQVTPLVTAVIEGGLATIKLIFDE